MEPRLSWNQPICEKCWINTHGTSSTDLDIVASLAANGRMDLVEQVRRDGTGRGPARKVTVR